jgi:hypothetical protein
MNISGAQNTINFFPYFAINQKLKQLVVALRYNPSGRGFDYRWGNWDFSLP